jgi:hypothetical protein
LNDYGSFFTHIAVVTSLFHRCCFLFVSLFQIMYLMALDEFMNKGPADGDSSYHAIAGIHGAGGSYNGQSAPSAG